MRVPTAVVSSLPRRTLSQQQSVRQAIANVSKADGVVTEKQPVIAKDVGPRHATVVSQAPNETIRQYSFSAGVGRAEEDWDCLLDQAICSRAIGPTTAPRPRAEAKLPIQDVEA